MKHYITILFILLGYLSFGQTSPDTCITKNRLHDLHDKVFYLTEQNRIAAFQIRLLTALQQVDSVHHSADSLVVKYLSKTGNIIRILKKYLKKGCTKDSLLIHYNEDELIVYTERWHSTLCDADTTDKEVKHFMYKQSFARYEYDSLKRITKHVFHISTPMTRRTLISYDAAGKAIKSTIAIRYAEFWD